MAVFLSNVCKFGECGMKFASLLELIQHIEDCHLELETYETTCLPVSCILRIFPCSEDKIGLDLESNTLNEPHVRKSINSPAASLSTTPTEVSELDEDAGFESDSGQSSIDSWANVDPNTNQLKKFHDIMGSSVCSPAVEMSNSNKFMNGSHYHSSNMTPGQTSTPILNNNIHNVKNESGMDTPKQQRLYPCTINGCNKQYKTSNSLSHHKRSTHKIIAANVMAKTSNNLKTVTVDESNKKNYKCFCGKFYKTSHGFKNHQNQNHNNTNNHQTINVVKQAQDNNHETKPQIVQPNSLPQPTDSSHHQQNTQYIHVNTTTTNQLMTIKNNQIVTAQLAKNKLQKISSIFNGNTEIIADNSCPPVSVNVEVKSEPKTPSPSMAISSPLSSTPFMKTNPPKISAPTLQQHLLSPIISKVTST